MPLAGRDSISCPVQKEFPTLSDFIFARFVTLRSKNGEDLKRFSENLTGFRYLCTCFEGTSKVPSACDRNHGFMWAGVLMNLAHISEAGVLDLYEALYAFQESYSPMTQIVSAENYHNIHNIHRDTSENLWTFPTHQRIDMSTFITYVKASCHCGANTFQIPFLTSKLPQASNLCHCNACCPTTGNLAVHSSIVEGQPLSADSGPGVHKPADLSNLTKDNAQREFNPIFLLHLLCLPPL